MSSLPHSQSSMSLRHRFSLKRFFQGEGPEAGPITLVHRRVYILPSKMGVYFAVMLLVMLLGAVNYNNSLGYALTFLLSSICFVTMLHAYRNLLQLRVDVGHVPAVFCGETAQIPVILDNRACAERFAIKVQCSGQQHVTTDVAGDQWTQLTIPLKTQQRGVHQLPRISLRTTYPLGLFQTWSHAQRDVTYLVYPSPDREHGLPDEVSYHLNLQGDRGNGADDFAGLRNYHAGDSLRHVHWKTAAREQGMFTKQFGGDRAEELWLDWDSLPMLTTEEKLSRLARWVIDAEAAQVNYGLRLPGQVIAQGIGLAHRHQCLKALAMYQQTGSAVDASAERAHG